MKRNRKQRNAKVALQDGSVVGYDMTIYEKDNKITLDETECSLVLSINGWQYSSLQVKTVEQVDSLMNMLELLKTQMIDVGFGL